MSSSSSVIALVSSQSEDELALTQTVSLSANLPKPVSPEFSDPDELPSEAQETPALVEASASANAEGRGKASSSRNHSSLPLVVSEKCNEDLTLFQSADDALDLSGDVGTVGRVKHNSGSVTADLKGILYDMVGVPTNTLCLVSIVDGTAKIVGTTESVVEMHRAGEFMNNFEQVRKGTLPEHFGYPSNNEVYVPEPRRQDDAPRMSHTKQRKTTSKAGAGTGARKVSHIPRRGHANEAA